MQTKALCALGLAVFLTTHSVWASRPDPLDRRLTLELAGAAAADVLGSFAAILEAEPSLDPAIEGTVTIQLNNVSARTTLNAVCEMLDCEWSLEEGDERRFVVKAVSEKPSVADSPPGDLDTPLDLALRDAPVNEVLKSLASVGGWPLVLDKGTVTIELESAPVGEALDAVCAQAGCIWSLEEVDGKDVLKVGWTR